MSNSKLCVCVFHWHVCVLLACVCLVGMCVFVVAVCVCVTLACVVKLSEWSENYTFSFPTLV